MSEYSTYYNGEYTQVYDFNKCIKALQCINKDNEERIRYLEEENKKLKEEYYKDEELQKMKAEVEKMQNDLWRGFPISEEEEKAIVSWTIKHSHNCSKHNYSYIFVNTPLGVSGTVRCSCGAKFEFQEIG